MLEVTSIKQNGASVRGRPMAGVASSDGRQEHTDKPGPVATLTTSTREAEIVIAMGGPPAKHDIYLPLQPEW